MTACRIVAIPFAAYLADFHVNRRLLIIAFGFASFLAYAALGVAQGFHQILAFGILTSFCNAPIFILAEGFSSEGSAAHGVDYGRIRLWASISFLAGNLSGGLLLTLFSVGSLLLIMMVAQGISACVFLLLPEDPSRKREATPGPPRSLAAIPALFSGGFLLLLMAASLGQSSHAMLYSFGPVHWAALGFSTFSIGSFWAASIFAEVMLFMFGRNLVERFGAQLLIIGGAAGGAARWLLMSFDPGYAATALIQMGHAISFAMLHLGTMHYMLASVPSHLRNTAQGLYAACSGGIAMSIMMWSTGRLYGAMEGQTYLVMMAVSLCAVSAALALRRLSPIGQAAPAASRLAET
jgi:MFS transporter, PPP family, 3-phenylpropionic acid transporter